MIRQRRWPVQPPPPCLFAIFVLHKDNQSFINCIYSYFSQSYRALFLSWLTRASCIIFFISRSPFSLCKWDWFYIHSHFFFQIHKSRLYFSNDEFFPLKFNESFVNWRIVSMSPVQILKIKVLFTKIWLKIRSFVLFQIVFLCKQLYQRRFIWLVFIKNFIPFSVSFRFPFRSVFRSVFRSAF